MTYHEMMQMEREEMLRHKWIESEKAGHDLGQAALIHWAYAYDDAFHERVRSEFGEPTDVPVLRS